MININLELQMNEIFRYKQHIKMGFFMEPQNQGPLSSISHSISYIFYSEQIIQTTRHYC